MRTNKQHINTHTERYCHKCHKIKLIQEFVKELRLFKVSGVCNKCIN